MTEQFIGISFIAALMVSVSMLAYLVISYLDEKAQINAVSEAGNTAVQLTKLEKDLRNLEYKARTPSYTEKDRHEYSKLISLRNELSPPIVSPKGSVNSGYRQNLRWV